MQMYMKTKIPQLKREIRINKLGYQDVDNIPLIEADFDDDYLVEYAKMLSLVMAAVPDFDEKIKPLLLNMDPKDTVSTLFDLYKKTVIVNPDIDPLVSSMNKSFHNLPEDLNDFAGMLPNRISNSIKKKLYPVGIEMIDISGLPELYEEDVLELLNDPIELELDIERVKNIREELNKNIIGQSHAIDHMYAITRRLAIGFRDKNKPPCVLLFAGPTGTGKTLLTRTSAEFLFGDKHHLGRIDCATLSEKHDVSKLLGAPPGYVGYPSDRNGDPKDADPSVLYKETNGKNGGILLLDEVEKAHPDIWDIFLTAFDEGYVKTSVGNIIDLRNTMIVMTTNLGSKDFDNMQRKNPLGFSEAGEVCTLIDSEIKTIKKTANEALRDYMKPELIGRITDVVPFVNLNKEDIIRVIDLEWEKALEYLSGHVPSLSLSDTLKAHIADMTLKKKLGARPVQRLLEQYAVDAIAEIYLEHKDELDECESVVIEFKDEKEEGCDKVVVNMNGVEYEYVIKQTLSDE